MAAGRSYSYPLIAMSLMIFVQEARAQTLRVGVATTKRRPTDSSNMPVATSAALSAARNEFESFEIIFFNGPSRIDAIDAILTSNGLADASGHVIPAENVRVFREGYVTTTQASTSDVTAGDWPDVMIPRTDEVYNEIRCAFFAMGPRDQNASLGSCNATCNATCSNDYIPPNENRVFYVETLVPMYLDPPTNTVVTPAGVYSGNVHVTWKASGVSRFTDVRIDLRVRDFTLSSTASLRSYYKLDMCVAESAHGVTCAASPGGVWPGRDRPMRQLYARFLLDHRMTATFIYNTTAYPATYPDAFRVVNGFEDSYADLLNGTDSALRLKGAMPTAIPFDWGNLAYPPTMNQSTIDSDLRQMHSAWAREFKTTPKDIHSNSAQSWWARTLDKVCDEPNHDVNSLWNCGFSQAWPGTNTNSWVSLHRLSSDARALVPDFPIMITTEWDAPKSPAVASDISFFAPVLNWMWDKPNNSIYNTFQRHHYGTPVWWYQSCMSHGCSGATSDGPTYAYFPSYMVDVPFAAQNRAQEWFSWRYEIAGEHYYDISGQMSTAFNANGLWSKEAGGNGDGTLIYAGQPGLIGGTQDIPIASLRMKMIRAGMQDYEYLVQCAAKSFGTATMAVDTLFKASPGDPPPVFNSGVTMDDLYKHRETLASCAESPTALASDDSDGITIVVRDAATGMNVPLSF